ncbi:penicillin-binding protein 1A [Caulobacter sp. S45]|uniref:penicillin-binding protein 1A n=1 Tax=Caulobacter sp. S45 TaxID=1641861 RepID=UPI00131D2A56|nr:penicillin-binding protein 1A [Caulobacter sp. S45]
MKFAGRWAAFAGVAILSAVAVAGLGLAIYAALLFKDLPDAADLAEYRPPTSTRVYASDGTLIAQLGQERRIFTPYDQIPPLVVRAFLAAEDHKFFEHGGIDVEGLGRAMSRDVFRAANGRRLEGGSTITQQVAKNILLTNEVTFGRKVKEAILAQRIEQTLPKTRILEIYLNQIPLGYQSYGVGAAAYNYFGKPLSALTLSQAAFLAALPKGPANYHPIRHKAAAIGRRNWILGQMAELGWATRAETQAAMKEDLVVETKPLRAHYHDADYFVEEVRLRARGTISKDAETSGLYLRTTLDSKLQSAARIALMKGLETYDHRHGWRGAWGNTEVSADWYKAASVKPPPAERRGWRAAQVTKVGGGVAEVSTIENQTGTIEGADVAWAVAGKGLKVGDLVFVEPVAGTKRFNLRQVPAVNGALVAMEPHTGRILALVGGYSFSLSNFNRATQAARQPGSSFKPFVYAAALENGFTPASEVLDAPISLNGGNGKVYSPENYEHTYSGMTPFRNGLVYSKNTMTVRIAQRVGMHKIVEAAKRDGVADSMAPVLAMALGAQEVTPFRMVGAYAAFANGGKRVQPHLIELAEDHSGQVVWKADRRDCPHCDAPYDGGESPHIPFDGAQAMDPITAYQITLMLEGVTQRGTGAAVGAAIHRPIAGKTGTTNDFRSAWFVGYTPDLVVGVFVGFDDNRTLGNGETGAQASVPIFIDFMKEAVKDAPITDFVAPKDVKFAYTHGNREAFRPGTEPKPLPPAVPRLTPGLILPPGNLQGLPNIQLAPAGAPPPPPPPVPIKKPPPELKGLY